MYFSKDETISYLGEVIALEAESYTAKEIINYLESMRIPLVSVPSDADIQNPPETPPLPPSPPAPVKKRYSPTFKDYLEVAAGNIEYMLGDGRWVILMIFTFLGTVFYAWGFNSPHGETLGSTAVFSIIVVLVVFALVALGAFIFAVFRMQIEKQRLADQYEKEYKVTCREYEMQVQKNREQYRLHCRKLIEVYESKKKAYEARKNECIVHNHTAYRANSVIGETQKLFIHARTEILDTLKNLYAMGIVRPKYQNWVAVSSFYEYLDYGRCEELEGRDGAYNLFEDESKLNRIIGQLDVIITKLDVIASTQFKLYEELVRVNEGIGELKTSIDMGIQSIKVQTQAQAEQIKELSADMAGIGAGVEKGFLQVDEYLQKLERASDRAMRYMAEQDRRKF